VCPTCHAFHKIKVSQAAIKRISGLEVSNVIVSIPCNATVEIFFDVKYAVLDLRPVEILQVKYVIPEVAIPEKITPPPVTTPDASEGIPTTQEAPTPPTVEMSPEEMASQIQMRIQKIETHVMDLEISFLNEKLSEKQYKALTAKLLSIKEQLVKQLADVPK
jgi:hypothetical protein